MSSDKPDGISADLHKIVAPYLGSRRASSAGAEGWADKLLMAELGVHPDEYDDLIEDITLEFEVTRPAQEWLPPQSLMDRLLGLKRARWVLKPQDLTPRQLQSIVDARSWPASFIYDVANQSGPLTI